MYEITYKEIQTNKERVKKVTTYKELEYILEEILGSNFLKLVAVKPDKE
jgi:hypothetical protein